MTDLGFSSKRITFFITGWIIMKLAEMKALYRYKQYSSIIFIIIIIKILN